MWDNLYLCTLLSFLKFWSFWIFRSQSLQKCVSCICWGFYKCSHMQPSLPACVFSSPYLVPTTPSEYDSLRFCNLEQAAGDKWSKNLILKLKLPAWFSCSKGYWRRVKPKPWLLVVVSTFESWVWEGCNPPLHLTRLPHLTNGSMYMLRWKRKTKRKWGFKYQNIVFKQNYSLKSVREKMVDNFCVIRLAHQQGSWIFETTKQ